MEGIPYELIARQIRDGKVVPFLGAAASVFHAPDDRTKRPPSGAELSEDFATLGKFPENTDARDYPCALEAHTPPLSMPTKVLCSRSEQFLKLLRAERQELARVASYLEHEHGDRPALNDCLHKCFPTDHEPNDLHRLLAELAVQAVPSLVITTNYDDLVERAFEERSIEYHLIATRLDLNANKPLSVFHRKPSGISDSYHPVKVKVLDDQHPIIFKCTGRSIDPSVLSTVT